MKMIDYDKLKHEDFEEELIERICLEENELESEPTDYQEGYVDALSHVLHYVRHFEWT